MPIGEPQLACMVASTLTALISSMHLFDRRGLEEILCAGAVEVRSFA
jgi:hypothetical protein